MPRQKWYQTAAAPSIRAFWQPFQSRNSHKNKGNDKHNRGAFRFMSNFVGRISGWSSIISCPLFWLSLSKPAIDPCISCAWLLHSAHCFINDYEIAHFAIANEHFANHLAKIVFEHLETAFSSVATDGNSLLKASFRLSWGSHLIPRAFRSPGDILTLHRSI